MFSPNGERLQSFGIKGPHEGEFYCPCGRVEDQWGNILVVDCYNNHLQKFTGDGQFLATVRMEGSELLQFKDPKDLVFNPKNGKLYVIENTPRVQILNSGAFGTEGSGEGQLVRVSLWHHL